MYERLGSFTQNPSQKFHQNFINFEKTQKIFKNPIGWFYGHHSWEFTIITTSYYK